MILDRKIIFEYIVGDKVSIKDTYARYLPYTNVTVSRRLSSNKHVVNEIGQIRDIQAAIAITIEFNKAGRSWTSTKHVCNIISQICNVYTSIIITITRQVTAAKSIINS